MIIVSGDNATLRDTEGKSYVDLASGFGSAILGHNRKSVSDAVAQATGGIWNTGRETHPLFTAARDAVLEHLAAPYKVVAFQPTGGEASECAMRIACHTTGRGRFVGFEKSMHGKSAAASSLSWPTPLHHQACITLPFVPWRSEAEILASLDEVLRDRSVAAVFVEPIQGSNGGFEASRSFYAAVIELCARYGSLSIFDEVLAGWYRCGSASYALDASLSPNILIYGKCISNGFPSSAVLVDESITITPMMLTNTTFSNNPLACAAIVATIQEMNRIDIRRICEQIGADLAQCLRALEGVRILGKGLMWFIQYDNAEQAENVHGRLVSAGIYTSCVSNTIRVMPPATIPMSMLEKSLQTLTMISNAVCR